MRNLIALVALSAVLLSLGTQAFADEPEVEGLTLDVPQYIHQPATLVEKTQLNSGDAAESEIVGLDVRN